MSIIPYNQQKQQDNSQPYIPSKLPDTNQQTPKAPEYPNIAGGQRPIFTREFGDAINHGISDFKKSRNDHRGISGAKPLPQGPMSKKERRKQKWHNFWNGFKNGFGKVWNFGKKIIPFVPYGNIIKGGMDLGENAYNGIKNIFGKK